MIGFLLRTKETAAAIVRNMLSARESSDQAHREALARLAEAHATPEAQARHAAANEEFVRRLRSWNDDCADCGARCENKICKTCLEQRR